MKLMNCSYNFFRYLYQKTSYNEYKCWSVLIISRFSVMWWKVLHRCVEMKREKYRKRIYAFRWVINYVIYHIFNDKDFGNIMLISSFSCCSQIRIYLFGIAISKRRYFKGKLFFFIRFVISETHINLYVI